MSITLTKEQSYSLMLLKSKRTSKNIKTTSKVRWKCLGCLKTIYISFKECSIKSIYCSDCLDNDKTLGKGNVVEHQYLRKLKESQLNLYENFLNSNSNI